MLADYYARGAVAAAQVIEGFDEARFRGHLEATAVGLSTDAAGAEAEAVADLAVRLLARLYPRLAIVATGESGERLRALAAAINPQIELVERAEIGIVVGGGQAFPESVFAGAAGWDALLDPDQAQSTGQSANPFGAGAAAALAAAAVFRRVFLPDWQERRQPRLRFSALHGSAVATASGAQLPAELSAPAALIGAGAIGHGALWALRRLPLDGLVHVVDGERLELGNLQRYVLAERQQVDEVKVEQVCAGQTQLQLQPAPLELVPFLATQRHRCPAMLLALDSAADRVAAQASLPGWVANAWTQPGDLGISSHSPFGGPGACVSCLYLPEGPAPNEDEIVAAALGIPGHVRDVRAALATGAGVERPLLEAIAVAVGRSVEVLLPFEGRPIRQLYVEGFCGGAVIPLGEAGKLAAGARDVHVPLAHQSALAGVLLAAALVSHELAAAPEITRVTRLDLMRPVAELATQPMRARRDGRCLCDDADFVAAHRRKYPQAA
jgi:hypothetical protein